MKDLGLASFLVTFRIYEQAFILPFVEDLELIREQAWLLSKDVSLFNSIRLRMRYIPFESEELGRGGEVVESILSAVGVGSV